MLNKIIPIKIDEINENFYSGFWSRLGAVLLDFLFIFLITFLYAFIFSFLDSINNYVFFITMSIFYLLILWYCIYFSKRFGGTLGKIIVGIKIIRMDSSPIGWKEAFLRESLSIALTLMLIIIMLKGIIFANDEVLNNLTWSKKMGYLKSFEIFGIYKILSNIWTWSEIVVLLFNKRKRAIHDFIAKTVVVKTKYIEIIREKMKDSNGV